MTEKDWLKLLNLPKPYSGECQRLRVGWRNSKKKKRDAAAGLASRPHNLPQTHKSSQVSADFSPPQRPRHTNDATARRASRLAVTAKAATVTQRWRASSETDADLAAAAQPSEETPVRCQSSGTDERCPTLPPWNHVHRTGKTGGYLPAFCFLKNPFTCLAFQTLLLRMKYDSYFAGLSLVKKCWFSLNHNSMGQNFDFNNPVMDYTFPSQTTCTNI